MSDPAKSPKKTKSNSQPFFDAVNNVQAQIGVIIYHCDAVKLIVDLLLCGDSTNVGGARCSAGRREGRHPARQSTAGQ